MTTATFDPTQHLIQIKTRGVLTEYLPVAARLAWCRAEYPEAAIETELMAQLADEAIFRARITIPGRGSATGWGSETRADFPAGHLEKAETKALGRALAALGYGTLQAGDDLDEGGAVVDAPQPAAPAGMPLADFADYLQLLWRMGADDVPGKVILGQLQDHDDELSAEQATIVKAHWGRIVADRKRRAAAAPVAVEVDAATPEMMGKV